MAGRLDPVQAWARALKREILVLWLAAGDARVPLAAKLVASFVAAYALSPIDLIPDFIPVLGLVDDLLLVPAGIWLALRLIPAGLLDELRAAAAGCAWPAPTRSAVVAIVAIWLAACIALAVIFLGGA